MICKRARWVPAFAVVLVLVAGWGSSLACDNHAKDTAQAKEAKEVAKPCCAKKAAAIAANGQAAPAAGCGAKTEAAVATAAAQPAAETKTACPHAAKAATLAKADETPEAQAEVAKDNSN